MTTVHRRVGHQIGTNPGDIHFPRGGVDVSTLTCSCAHKLDAPTPELLEVEWAAHRREVRAGEARPLGKVPGYTFGGAFK